MPLRERISLCFMEDSESSWKLIWGDMFVASVLFWEGFFFVPWEASFFSDIIGDVQSGFEIIFYIILAHLKRYRHRFLSQDEINLYPMTPLVNAYNNRNNEQYTAVIKVLLFQKFVFPQILDGKSLKKYNLMTPLGNIVVKTG